jgi:tetratricopeptide (TPR) repeat protein
MKKYLSKQESKNLINTLLKNSHNQLFLEKTINKNIETIGQTFFEILEEAVENAEDEGKYESAEFLLDLGEKLFDTVNHQLFNDEDLDNLVEESLELFYSSDDIEPFIEQNREQFTNEYIHTILAEIEHVAVDYGREETAFYLLDRVAYFVERIDTVELYLGFVYMCRVNILNEYAQYSDALIYIDKAITYFRKDSYEIAEALATKGEILKDIETLQKSNRLFHLLRKKETIHCDSLIQNYKVLGALYQKEGNFYKASKYLNVAMDLADKSEILFDTKIELLYDYATLKVQQGHYSEASNYLYYIYVVSKKFNYHKMMFNSLYSLANIFLIIGDFEEAREYIIKASEINNQLDRELELAYCYYVLGVIELNLWKKSNTSKSVRKAIVSFNRAIKLLKESEDTKLYGEILYEIGIICKEQGYNDKAITYFNDSLRFVESYNYKSYIYGELALLYASMDEFEYALVYLEKADNLIEKKFLKERAEFYFVQGQIYFMQNKLEKHWRYFYKQFNFMKK